MTAITYKIIANPIICQNANKAVPKSIDKNFQKNIELAISAQKFSKMNANAIVAWINFLFKVVSSFAGNKLSHVSNCWFVANGLILNSESHNKL